MTTEVISQLDVQRFGPFDKDYELTFEPSINLIVGDNGTGKSQLLKLLYSCTAVMHDVTDDSELTKSNLQKKVASKLLGVFSPDSLGRLTNRQRGRAKAVVGISYAGKKQPLRFSFATNSKTEVKVDAIPEAHVDSTPVFLPSRELMSIFPGFVSLYDSRQVAFDETWRDTCNLLGRAPLRRTPGSDVDRALQPIMGILGGKVDENAGRFYLHRDEGTFEMPLVAEGLRKLATIYRLVQSGVLLNSGFLFWDEPEANLNPASQKAIVQTVIELAKAGVQVFMGTHSAYLLRQFDYESRHNKAVTGIGYTALRRTGTSIDIAQGSSLSDFDEEYLQTLKAEYEQTELLLDE
ncbi:AAA family ATPase [Bifidobacterium parmae]|uniref:ATP-binding protein n=1 Tax=Bifidobacterium parmae TaxID=361854 RepID=A0A2N5J385_9BIFI|nr:ATP-binding protein [Bifidobacterium parmae]PLS28690.1 ATP-binding protein [Bifidobacterium parmae]